MTRVKEEKEFQKIGRRNATFPGGNLGKEQREL